MKLFAGAIVLWRSFDALWALLAHLVIKTGSAMPQHFQNRTPDERLYILEEQMIKVQKMLEPNGFLETKVLEYESRIKALEDEIKALKK